MALNTYAVVATLLSTIISVIKEVEKRSIEAKAAGEPVFTGSFKLALALGIIEDVYNATVPSVPFDTVKSVVTGTIATLVSVYNALGIFKKSAA